MVDEVGGIPVRKKKPIVVKPKSQAPIDEKYKPLNPWFCDCRDPETGEICNNLMRSYDHAFYNRYGMCEQCFLKYNPNVEKV